MKTLAEACTPRDSVFEHAGKDTVYDLGDLDKIDPAKFFSENFFTQGMRQLLGEGLKRLEGKSSASGTYLLSQSMGGGKTHSLLALGLAAKYPDWRKKATQSFYDAGPLGAVRVVAFSGRKTRTPYGLWGEIAEQLNRREALNDFYSPLSPPGVEDWVRLLRGEPTLVLLDELPPYFEAARALPVGATHLDAITTTALANLLVAVNSDKLANVCLVLTDLRGSAYGSGSQSVSQALNDLEKEVGRQVTRIDPVQINSNELYHILRVRLFDQVGDTASIAEVAGAYSQRLDQARLMELTSASPQQLHADITSTYPFHPAIRDLYARFKENPGFQQTRALIRIMRHVVAELWQSDRAKAQYLIGAEDVDLHRGEMLSEIRQINPTLEAAIAHDVAAEQGSSVAEQIDGDRGGTDAQDAATLIFMSSLSQAVNPTLGLDRSEIVSYLVAPEREPTSVREALDRLQSEAWYLHPTPEGRLLFKNTENIVAKLDSYSGAMAPEVVREELRERLREMFRPDLRTCYQRLEVLPELDRLSLQADETTLVVFAPSATAADEITRFWEHQQYQNRGGFLTGPTAPFETVLYRARELRAIRTILEEMRREGRRETDPQLAEAEQLRVKKQANFYQACRETFQELRYPTAKGLTTIDVDPQYVANDYRGEEQVLQALKEAFKFREDTGADSPFRNLVESKLWPEEAKEVAWGDLKRRAATDPGWIWHHPRALDALKDELITRDQWRANGTFVERGPFAVPDPSATVQVLSRDEQTGVATLRVRPLHADAVYYSEQGPPTTESPRVDGDITTKAVRMWFAAHDGDADKWGPPHEWTNLVTVKHRLFAGPDGMLCELRAIPSGSITYTVDGSAPQTSGQDYDGPFPVSESVRTVLAIAESDGVTSAVTSFDLPRDGLGGPVIDPKRPASWRRRHQLDDSNAAYTWLDLAARHEARLGGSVVTVMRDERWIEFRTSDEVLIDAGAVRLRADELKTLLPEANLNLVVMVLSFNTGMDLSSFVSDARLTIEPGEVVQ